MKPKSLAPQEAPTTQPPLKKGLTLFERKGATVGQSAMAELLEQAQNVLRSTPHEGQEISWRGAKARWSLVESTWASSRFGSGELTLRYGDERYELWFNQ